MDECEIECEVGGLDYYGDDSRAILISGCINEEVADNFIAKLYSYSASEGGIFVHLNSPGGDLIQALTMYDVMKSITCPIITIGQGLVESAAFLLLQAGDRRYAFPHSVFYFHMPVRTYSDDIRSPKEHKEHSEFYELLCKRVDKIVGERCGLENFNKRLSGSTTTFLSAEEMVELGLLDRIFEYQTREVAPITHGSLSTCVPMWAGRIGHG